MWNIGYDIHNLLKIKITGKYPSDLGRNLKYSFFKIGGNIDDPDIVLNIGKFRPSNEDCDYVSHKYYIKQNYIYCKDKGRNTRWEVEINGIEQGRTVINFNGKDSGIKGILFPTFLAQEFLIPTIEYKLAQKNNHFLIHAGAVSKGNDAYAFVGRPGAYKTTLIMDLMRKKNYSLLSDDRIIISKGGVLPFPISLFLFDFMTNFLDTEKRKKRDEIILIKKLLFDRCYRQKLPISSSSILKSLIFVSRADTNRINKIDVSLTDALNKLIINNKSEYISFNPTQPSESFHRYAMVYSLMYPENELLKYWDTLYGNLNDILRNLQMFEIIMPFEYNKNFINTICDYIE